MNQANRANSTPHIALMTHTTYDFGAMPDFLLFGQKTLKMACGKQVSLYRRGEPDLSVINNTEPECAACRVAIQLRQAERDAWQNDVAQIKQMIAEAQSQRRIAA